MSDGTLVRAAPRQYAVPRVARIEFREDGTTVRTVLSSPKRKRVSKRYRRIDKAMRRVTRAQRATATEFLDRHDRSNRKKKNGGVRDVGKNLWKANRKGVKKLRIV